MRRMQLPLLRYIAAVFKHWLAFVLGGAVAGLLSFLADIGRVLPHWVYWLFFGVVGWLVASYRAWLDEHYQVGRLREELDGEDRKQKHGVEKRELLQIITALREQKGKLLYWRDITNGKWGMILKGERLELNDLAATLHWAEKIDSSLRTDVERFEAKIVEAQRLINEFMEQPPAFRQENLIRRSYTLLDETLPHLDRAVTRFEQFEKQYVR